MELKTNIFLVEDDLNFGMVLKSYLEMNDYDVTWVSEGDKAFKEFKTKVFNICILDVMLPKVDGFTIAKLIKAEKPLTPIIFLTAKTLKQDIIEGYKIGADDYITKPFDSELLLYKLKAILSRNNSLPDNNASTTVKIGLYTYNQSERILCYKDKEIKLSPKENELLSHLYKNLNKVLERETALKSIWGNDDYFTARSMDVYITKLRKYLLNDKSISIENIHGSGYILKVKTFKSN